MVTNPTQIQDQETRKRLFKLVERRRGAREILSILGISREDVVAYTFESCSFVVALSDGKTVVEVCHCPENISSEDHPLNPLFNRQAEEVEDEAAC